MKETPIKAGVSRQLFVSYGKILLCVGIFVLIMQPFFMPLIECLVEYPASFNFRSFDSLLWKTDQDTRPGMLYDLTRYSLGKGSYDYIVVVYDQTGHAERLFVLVSSNS